MVSAAVEQSKHKAKMVAQGDLNSALEANPRIHQYQKKKSLTASNGFEPCVSI